MKRILLCMTFVSLFWLDTCSADVLIVADEFPAMENLARHLKQEENIESKLVKQDALPANLSAFSAVIVYIHGKLAAPPANAMIAYTRAGGKLIALHHSISSGKRQTETWLPFLGVDLVKDDVEKGGYKWIEPALFQVVNLAPEHFITSNKVSYEKQISYAATDSQQKLLPAFVLHESEVYLNHKFTCPHKVLFGLKYEDSKTGKTWMQDRAGWVMASDKGWIVYLMAGHKAEEFDNPIYSRIVLNAVVWKP